MFSLVIVVGTPSGGTSATSGTLISNGYYGGEYGAFYEHSVLHGVLKEAADNSVHFHDYQYEPSSDRQMMLARTTYMDFRSAAEREGCNRAVLKIAGGPLKWTDVVDPEKLQLDWVKPLLVYRGSTAFPSAAHRFKNHAKSIDRGQQRILEIKEKHGWPMWQFGAEDGHEQIEQAVGHKLPIRYYNPHLIKYKQPDMGQTL